MHFLFKVFFFFEWMDSQILVDFSLVISTQRQESVP